MSKYYKLANLIFFFGQGIVGAKSTAGGSLLPHELSFYQFYFLLDFSGNYYILELVAQNIHWRIKSPMLKLFKDVFCLKNDLEAKESALI